MENSDSVADLGFAKLDLDRSRRVGLGETVFGSGKTPGQFVGIVRALRERSFAGAENCRCGVPAEELPDRLKRISGGKKIPDAVVIADEDVAMKYAVFAVDAARRCGLPLRLLTRAAE